MLRPLLPAAALPLSVALLGTVVAPAPALADSPTQWCRSARQQVLEWSVNQAADRGRPYVTAIHRSRTTMDRVIEAPTNGIILRCRGRGLLSNGVTTTVKYGFRAIDGSWYLFLKRAH